MTDAWVHEDQTLPPALARRFARRAAPPPEVKALRLHADFSKAGSAQCALNPHPPLR